MTANYFCCPCSCQRIPVSSTGQRHHPHRKLDSYIQKWQFVSKITVFGSNAYALYFTRKHAFKISLIFFLIDIQFQVSSSVSEYTYHVHICQEETLYTKTHFERTSYFLIEIDCKTRVSF